MDQPTVPQQFCAGEETSYSMERIPGTNFYLSPWSAQKSSRTLTQPHIPHREAAPRQPSTLVKSRKCVWNEEPLNEQLRHMWMLLFWFCFTFNTSSQMEEEKEVFVHNVPSNCLNLRLSVFTECRLPSGGERHKEISSQDQSSFFKTF